MISEHPLNNDLKLFYNPKNHSYIDTNKVIYTSVTTLIGKYFTPFNTDQIATNCAKKRGVSKESLISEWYNISQKALVLGNSIHDYFECLLMNKKPTDIDKFYKIEVDKIYKSIIKELDLIYSEKIIFSPKLKIAGTCDALFITKDRSRYVLMDWKTSKKIEISNYYKSYGLKPIEYLPDCNYVHFSLQLKMYGEILKNEGYLKEDLPIVYKIIHVKPNESKSWNILDLDISDILKDFNGENTEIENFFK